MSGLKNLSTISDRIPAQLLVDK